MSPRVIPSAGLSVAYPAAEAPYWNRWGGRR
jgi:hypothetical protein